MEITPPIKINTRVIQHEIRVALRYKIVSRLGYIMSLESHFFRVILELCHRHEFQLSADIPRATASLIYNFSLECSAANDLGIGRCIVVHCTYPWGSSCLHYTTSVLYLGFLHTLPLIRSGFTTDSCKLHCGSYIVYLWFIHTSSLILCCYFVWYYSINYHKLLLNPQEIGNPIPTFICTEAV